MHHMRDLHSRGRRASDSTRQLVESLEPRTMLSVSFRSPIDTALQSRPESLALGDFNGDGNVDVAEPSIYTPIDFSGAIVPVLPGDGSGNLSNSNGGGFTPGFTQGVMFE